MEDRKYRIWMEERGDLPEGWYCGVGARINEFFHRCDDKRDADIFDDEGAVSTMVQMKRLNYVCEEVPRISNKRKLEILFPD